MINEIIGFLTFLSVFSGALDKFVEFGGVWYFLKVVVTGIMAFIATAGWMLVILIMPYFLLDTIMTRMDEK